MNHFRKVVFLLFFLNSFYSNGQDLPNIPIHGNVELNAQYYLDDTIIGAPDVPEKLLSNGFVNLTYEKDYFSAGLRYESYLNPILGYDERYKGSGFPYKFITFHNDQLEITAGNFYDQFGSGLVLRTYEDRGLGYDNAFEGIRVKFKPVSGIYLKGIIARQRDFFNTGEGIVRAFDAEWNLNEACAARAEKKTNWILGGSFVSKFQEDQNSTYILPENVGTTAGRISMNTGPWSVSTEVAYKINDPSAANKYIYKDGNAFLVNAGYSVKGLGVSFGFKRIDNMSFRSDRDANQNSLMINYLPAMTKNQTYLLAALYPYATQPTGEYGIQGEVFYNLKPESMLGGHYGTDVAVNYSRATAISKTPVDTTGNPYAGDEGYTSEFLKFGNEIYFEDFNIGINRKLNKELKMILYYVYQNYNKDVIEGRTGFGHVYASTIVFELNYKITSKRNLRAELQHLSTKQDQQNWMVVLAEYSISPHWFFSAFDEYNYGNDNADRRFHYMTVNIGYTKNANRISLGFGRQRAGILCVGGVCRNVPASNGFTLSVTSSF